MFWGITLEHGNIYTQIVEQSFHISMAALGFENLTPDATTVMVESEKAAYALCTLQAGKIPQQPLDLNFTEGEEVKFFLEGNGGVVHVTGYLLETPREYEFDEDELDDLLSSGENATSSDSDQEKNDAKSSGSSEEYSSKDEDDEMKVTGATKIEPEEKSKKKIEDDESDDSNEDDDAAGVPWQSALIGNLDKNAETSNSEDHDWNPRPTSKRIQDAAKLKAKLKKPKKKKQPISQTLVDLMDIGGDESEESSDEDWAPKIDEEPSEVSMATEDNNLSSLNGDVSS